MATATQTSFKPLGNRVVVKPSEADEQMSAGGIYIPDTAKERPQEGEVVAVGAGRITDDGSRVQMELAVGDVVVYSKYAGTEYNDGDAEYLVLREDDILFKKSSFKPLGNRVVVKPSEAEEQVSAGGIYIPDTAKEKPQEGEVVAVGAGRITDDGSRVQMELAVGDVVVYSKYAGTEYNDGDAEYLVLREDDILFKK